MHSYFLFFKDKSYIHYDRQTETAIVSGKLPFVATKSLPSKVKGRLLLLGLNDDDHFLVSSINVLENYLIESRELSNIKL